MMFNFGRTDEILFAVITECKMPVLQFTNLAVNLTLIYNTALYIFKQTKKRKKEKKLFQDSV